MLDTSFWFFGNMDIGIWFSTLGSDIVDGSSDWCTSSWSFNGFDVADLWVFLHPETFTFTDINVESSSWVKICASLVVVFHVNFW